MLARLYATFRFELRQALRRKGLWLLATALLAGTYFLCNANAHRGDPRAVGEFQLLQQTGILFLNFSWVVALFPPLGLAATGVAIFLTLYLAGKGQSPLLDGMVFTKPISTLELQLGRFLSIATVLTGLSLMPVLALVYFYSRHRYYPWAWNDFATLWALGLLWPMGIAAAVAWWARNVFRSVLLASAAALIPLGLLHAFDPVCHASPFWFLQQMRDLYGLPLGFHFPGGEPIRHLYGGGLWALAFLGGSCYYLRRRMPDWRPAPAGRRQWLDTPTFRQLLQPLHPDRNVGKDAAAWLFIALLGLLGFGGLLWTKHSVTHSRWERWNNEWRQLSEPYPPYQAAKEPGEVLHRYAGPSPPAISVTHYDLDLEIYPSTTRLLAGTCTLLLANGGPRSATEIPLLLNPGLEVQSVEALDGPGNDRKTLETSVQADWRTIPFRRVFNQLWLSPSESLPPDAAQAVRIHYEGSLVRDQSGPGAYLETRLDRPVWQLEETDLFYPIPVRLSSSGGGAADLQPGYFTAMVRARVPEQPALVVLCPGRRENDRTVATFPQSRLVLIGGPFVGQARTLEGLPVRLYTLPGHEPIGRVFLEDVEWMLRDTLRHLGGFPYPELLLYDDAGAASHRPRGPGIVPVRLDSLLQWKTTLDTFNRRFKRRLNRSRYFVYVDSFDADRLQDALIQSCFQDAVHPVGPLAPLLWEYLPQYVQWTLRPGAQGAQRFTRQYDIDLNQKPLYRRPLRQMLSGNTHRFVLEKKSTALFHMLRHLMGESQWEQLLQAYLERYRFEQVRFADFRRLAGEVAGEDLDWFFEQWLDQPALPEYRITRAQGQMFDDPQTLGMDYHVSIEVINDGTGRMRIPLYLKTEGDDIIEPIMLDTGQRRLVELDVPDRPLFASVDPEGWILQGKHYHEKGKVGRMEVAVDILSPQAGRAEQAR